MIMKNGTKGIHRLLGLLLALTMLLSLVAPVLNVAYAQPDEGIGSESVEEAAEEQVPEPHEEEALPVEDTETEEQEEETEPVTEWEDPVAETEEDVTPDPETEDETEEPDVTEDAVEEEEETEEPEEEHPDANPDHVVPDGSPYGGQINYGIYPETRFGIFQSVPRNLLNAVSNSPSTPGEVTLSKVATPVPGMVNTWDITLRIEGKDKPTTSDIVLVIDTSGSMNEYRRMAAARTAANKFVDELLPSDNTRIGVVSFANVASTRRALTNNATNLHAAINALSATGGTHTQAGVAQAQALLDNSDADNKHIVLLSDGEPTYSFGMHNPNGYLSSQRIEYASPGDSWWQSTHNVSGNRQATISAIPESQFTGNTVGESTAMFHRYSTASGGLYYNHGNSAIAQANFAKANSRVWTIALSVSTAGQGVLNQMASPGSYFTAEPADLEAIFQNIAGQIGRAVKDATVSDAMGGGFHIPGGVDSVTVSQGTVASTNGSLNWNPGTLTVPIAPGSDIRFAEMKYRVEINNDILSQTPNANGEYPTNSFATINYTDADGNPANGTFPVPMVDPILLIVEKVLKNDKGEVITEDERVFDVKITGNNGYDQTYKVSAGQRKVMTNLRLEDTYTVAETNVSGPSNVEDYETTINIYGEDTNTFVINQEDPDTPVRVTNQEKSLGKLTVKKVFYNMPEPAENVRDRGLQVLQTPLVFDFVLTKPDGTTEEFSLTADNTKVFENLPYGVYKVEETTTGYTTVYDPANGKVELTFDNREATVTVSNRVLGNDAVTATKKWTGELQPVKPDVWFKLYRESAAEEKHAVPNAEIKKLPTGPDAEYTVSWDDVPEYDEKGNAYTYSVQEVYEDGSNYVPGGYSKTEDGLTVSNEHQTTDTTNITSLRFVKEWKGDYGDWTPTITVEVYNKATGETVRTAQLTYPDTTIEWKNLPYMDDDGNVIDYGIREVNVPGGITPSDPTETESAIESIYYEPSQSSTDWSIPGYPSFVITRTTKNGPFVIWTLNHLPEGERHTFLTNLFAAAANDMKQPIIGLKGEYEANKANIIWIEGAQVNHDIFPDIEGVGMITINIQFNEDGTIKSSDLNYEGPNTWTHFAVGGYSSKEISITNTYNAGSTDVNGMKTWDDRDNQDGKRPDSIVIKLWKSVGGANPVLVESKTVTAAEEWKWSWTGLPEYEMGKPVVYTITEDPIDDYTTEIDGYNVTNSYTPETVDVEGMKTWDDMDNQDGMRPAEITIHLWKTVGENESVLVETITVTETEEWKWSFTDLPKYEGGQEITYTITEDPIDGYTTEVNGYDVTNTHEPSKININVTKVWENTSTYPEKVTIKLLANGEDTGKTLVLTKENNWTGTFEDLDEYSNGEKIEYTISEEHLADYETTYSGNAKDGFVVTNTRIYTPPTGINLDFLPYVLLLAVAGVGIGATILRKRKDEA